MKKTIKIDLPITITDFLKLLIRLRIIEGWEKVSQGKYFISFKIK